MEREGLPRRATKKTSLNGVKATAGWSRVRWRRGENIPAWKRDHGLDAPKSRPYPSFRSGRCRFGGRDRGDRLQDLRSDLVGVALRVRAAIFQIALVSVVHEAVRNADRGAAV